MKKKFLFKVRLEVSADEEVIIEARNPSAAIREAEARMNLKPRPKWKVAHNEDGPDVQYIRHL